MNFFKNLQFRIEYVFVRILAAIFSSLPWKKCSAAGGALGVFASMLFRRRFRLTIENLSLAFPGKGGSEIKTIARQSWKNMGRTAAEFGKAFSLDREELLKRCSIQNTQTMLSYLKAGKGVIIHLGHIANWEVMGIVFGASGLEMCAIARRIKNPYVNTWVTVMRQRYGGVVIPHKNPFFRSAKALKQGKILGILMDQNMPKGDTFLPFFGRQAATTPITALLSLKTGAPIFPLHVMRETDGITAVLEEPIIPSGECTNENVNALLARLNLKLEDWIRQDPGMWLWAHNRWKRSYEAKKNGSPSSKDIKKRQSVRHP